VIFDVGHGGGSFVFRNAVPATAQGFYPDTISTDLHADSQNAAMMDMPTSMSKFLAMGMPLEAVVYSTTWKPAQVIRHEELGHLSVGARADIAVWTLVEGSFAFRDAFDGRIAGNRRLRAEMTFLNGKVMWDWNARTGTGYQQLGSDYGTREVDSQLTP